MPLRRRLVVIVSLLAVAAAGAATSAVRASTVEIVEQARVAAIGSRADAQSLLRQWQGMLARGEDARLARAWPGAESTADALAWEWASVQLLQDLAAAAPRDALEPVLEAIAARPARTLVRHPETVADWFVPAFDVSGAAAALQRSWAIERSARAWSQALARKDFALDLLAKRAAGDPVEASGLRLAVQRTDPAVLRERAADLAAAGVAGAAPGALAALALRTGTAGDYFTALAREPAAEALALVSSAHERLGRDDAVAFLAEAAQRDELASAATLALAPLARGDGAARDLLLAAIGDPTRGESAAAALAGLDDPRAFDALAVRLLEERNEAAQQHLLLYLRLRGDAAALAAARAFAASPFATPRLAREVAAW